MNAWESATFGKPSLPAHCIKVRSRLTLEVWT
uniref:Uncharacterized protein n=1 Tax=Utricularia reniformis TaxID=192314 RepID=A0A1Y0B058_9LAMI|nr:hypothetical protein AEK19_MT0513 [Utricularia reniformis]ART30769.1 hypothetical protein AEK19_MT0513 [Utricularia reniformis]